MDRLARQAIDQRRALAALPPLVKGYMRVGAKFGDGAVVDRQFGVTDVFVVMPIVEIEGHILNISADQTISRVSRYSVMLPGGRSLLPLADASGWRA